jgi:hypothetical protein
LYCKISSLVRDVIATSSISTKLFSWATAALTKAVVANCVVLVPTLAVGAVGVPVKLGLSLTANSLSIVKVATVGDTVTECVFTVVSESVNEPPEVSVTVKELGVGGSTVTELTVCVTVAVSFAIR